MNLKYVLALLTILLLGQPALAQRQVVYVYLSPVYYSQPAVVSGYYPVQVYQPAPTYYQAQPLPLPPVVVPSGSYYAGGGVYEAWSMWPSLPLPPSPAPSYYPRPQQSYYQPTYQPQQSYYQPAAAYGGVGYSSLQRGGVGSCPSCSNGACRTGN